MEDAGAAEALARLRRWLRERQGTEGLTTTQLSRKAGLGRTTVSNALNDRTERPTWNTVATIATALRFSKDEITQLHQLWEQTAPEGALSMQKPVEPSQPAKATPGGEEPAAPTPNARPRNHKAGYAVVVTVAVLAAIGGGLAKWQPWEDGDDATGAGDRVTSKGLSEENKATATAPVKVVSVSQQDTGANSWAFEDAQAFSASELESINANSLTDETYAWFTSKGAAPVDRRRDLITVEGNTSKPVEINDLQVDKQCRAPLSGTLFESPSAGQNQNIRIALDLDEQLPTAKSIEKDGSSSPNYFARHAISLKQGERQNIVVDAATKKYYCEYTLNLQMTVGDETVTQVVMDNGKPFKLSAHVNGGEDTLLSGYQSAYVGGVLNTCGSEFRRVEPKTWTSLDHSC
jgi:transcriptional regulator with XRE-family HTH domain